MIKHLIKMFAKKKYKHHLLPKWIAHGYNRWPQGGLNMLVVLVVTFLHSNSNSTSINSDSDNNEINQMAQCLLKIPQVSFEL